MFEPNENDGSVDAKIGALPQLNIIQAPVSDNSALLNFEPDRVPSEACEDLNSHRVGEIHGIAASLKCSDGYSNSVQGMESH